MTDHARAGQQGPLVSVVLTTRDRPRLLPVALECYRQQTYPNRELIVVDDGELFPAYAGTVARAGGRVLRMEPGTPLGRKLNRGVAEVRGLFCAKMDDDDWYAPRYLEMMVQAIQARWEIVCTPTLAFFRRFLFFDLARWEVRQTMDGHVPGATLFFTRDCWEDAPFRDLRADEDTWFILDQNRRGSSFVQLQEAEAFIALRHGGGGGNRGHTWKRQATGQSLEEYLHDRPSYEKAPEALFPAWALTVYQRLRAELNIVPA